MSGKNCHRIVLRSQQSCPIMSICFLLSCVRAKSAWFGFVTLNEVYLCVARLFLFCRHVIPLANGMHFSSVRLTTILSICTTCTARQLSAVIFE